MQHDKIATAPNFLLAKERLKPDWVERWVIDPQAISPGTSMPSGLFRRDKNQWVFAGPTPPSFQGYDKDHTKLLVDYIFQLSSEEQRRVAVRRWDELAPRRSQELSRSEPPMLRVPNQRQQAAVRGKIFSLIESVGLYSRVLPRGLRPRRISRAADRRRNLPLQARSFDS
jgi:hypothetical protein